MAIAFQENPVLIIELDKADGTILKVERKTQVKNDANDFINDDPNKDLTADIVGQTLTNLQTGSTGVYDLIKTQEGVT